MRVLGPDRHEIAGPCRFTAQAPDDQGLADRRLFIRSSEAVVDLHPSLSGAFAEISRSYPPRSLSVQELMVHVHQVLVHEAIVAFDMSAEPPGLVAGRRRSAELRGRIGWR